MAIVCGAVSLIWFIEPNCVIATILFTLLCLVLTGRAILQIGAFWRDCLQNRKEALDKATRSEGKIKLMRLAVEKGLRARRFSHEMGNFLAILHGAILQGNLDKIRRCKESIADALEFFVRRSEHGSESVAKTITDLTTEFAANLTNKGVNVKITADSSCNDTLSVPVTLFWTVKNLASNGINAVLAKKGPRYQDSVTVRFSKLRHTIKVEIVDKGIGMEQVRIEALFAKEAESTTEGGMGVGFDSVLDWCSDHGFYLTCHSVIGKGTTFRLIVPLKDGPKVGGRDGVTTAPIRA